MSSKVPALSELSAMLDIDAEEATRLGIPTAAIIAAMGGIQIATIASTEFGSGGGGSRGGLGGSSGWLFRRVFIG